MPGKKITLLCIDPGPEKSGVVVFDGKTISSSHSSVDNDVLVSYMMPNYLFDHMAIESVSCFGMPVGKEVFETCEWIGRFIQAFPGESTKIERREVKMYLCNSMQAKDPNIRQAIIDRFFHLRVVAKRRKSA